MNSKSEMFEKGKKWTTWKSVKESGQNCILTALGEELGENVLKGILINVTGRALLLKAPVNHLYLLAGKACLGREGGQLLWSMADVETHRTRAP